MDTELIGGRYRLDGELGSGGMGTVWRAYDELLARQVAVKEIRFPAHTSPREHAELTARAMTEARAAAALTHPAIVAVYDVTMHDDRPWIVMQLVPGRSLQQVVAEDGPLSPEEAGRLCLRLLDALQTAHAARVMHRDVKPSNVLMPGGGATAMLTDFSIAKVMGYGTTNTDMPVGSAGYMAPERMLTGTTGFEGDLFGLGATLFFALEGVGPFNRPDAMVAILAAAVEPHPRPQRAGPHTALLDALLAKDPRQRATLSQARAMLLGTSTMDPAAPPTPAPTPAPSLPPAPSPPTPPALPARSEALPALDIERPRAGEMAAEVVAPSQDDPSTVHVPQWNKVQSRAGFTRGRASVATSAPAEAVKDSPPAEAEPQPREERVWPRRGLFVAAAGLATAAAVGGTAWALRKREPGPKNPGPGATGKPPSDVDVLSGHRGEVWAVAWAPDSQRLASASEDFTVRLWKTTSAESTRLLTGHDGVVYSVEWSPDGARLATGAADNTARIWDAQTGDVVKTLPHDQAVRSVTWSPDGKQLATGSNDRRIRIWDTTSWGVVHTLVGHATAVLAVAWSPDGQAIASVGDLGDQGGFLLGEVIAARIWDPSTGNETRKVTTGKKGAAGPARRSNAGTSVRLAGYAAAQPAGTSPATTSIAWSSDSGLLATGNDAFTTWLWDAQTGAQLRVLTGHTDIVNAVAFKPDEALLVTGSADRTILLWNPGTRTILRTFSGHTDEVNSLAFSPDGKRLVSGSSDKTLRLWTPVA